MKIKNGMGVNVLEAAKERISYTFDEFDKIVVSFSGGKDSSVMLHLAAQEAIKRERRICVLIIDMEAQYRHTIQHLHEMLDCYGDVFDVHWVCLPMNLRNASSNFEPVWTCWDDEKEADWVRELPKHKGVISDLDYYPFFEKGMEFEEFVVLFAEWYSDGENTACLVGIRADESLNRFRTIAIFDKEMYNNKRWSTKVTEYAYNIYPIYDWHTRDIWRFHAKNPDLPYNQVYDLMQKAGVKLSQQRLCQPYGDDQRRGLWLYHILEPETWYKLITRVNGVNSGALYIQETGNINGYNKINLPDGHTYKSFCNLLLATMPKVTREHFTGKFRSFMKGWAGRGYTEGLPDYAPKVLEDAQWAPSWRRMCKVLLRNDWWCKGLGMTQPKSEAYGKYLKIKKEKKALQDG